MLPLSDPSPSEPGTTEAGRAARLRGRRVLIIVENLPSPFDRRVWQEATTLRDHGMEVTIVCPTGPGYEARHERLEGIDIHRYPLPLEASGALGYLVEYGAAFLWQTWLAWKVFLRRGFDAVHACNPPDTIFLVALPFKLLGRPFLFDHHDINPELFEAKMGRRGPLWRALRVLERLTFACADVSIATNRSYERIAVGRGRMSPERVFVVRSGPDLGRIRPGPAVPRHRHGARHLVGWVGVMGEQEGIDGLLRVVRIVREEKGRDDVHFAIVGGGTELEAMRRYARELGVEDGVTFPGRVLDGELLEILNTADVCVNPDVASEMNDKSTMNKIMEYMALGKPVVQFDLTEGRFSAGEASLYVEPGDERGFADAILWLLDRPEERERMGRVGRERVEDRLAWRHQVPSLLAAYEALFDGRPAARGAAGAPR